MSDQQITLSQLEGHLWESANILRGPVDAADFKTYIFPLLFFKRICDVWDEEYQEIVDETGDEQLAWFPESHRFQIPEDCHWNDVRTKASNVGTALQRAMREIEKANPDTLYGVFGDAQWSNKDRLSDALLKDLIEHFSKLPFGNKNVNSDLLGDAYEYLIKKFADAIYLPANTGVAPEDIEEGFQVTQGIPLGDAGDVADRQALREWQQRARELLGEIEEAREAGDHARIEEIEEEMAFLTKAMEGGKGLGGRQRKAGDKRKNVRDAFRNAVDRAIRQIEKYDKPLGEHLKASIKHGNEVVYRPGVPIVWDVRPVTNG